MNLANIAPDVLRDVLAAIGAVTAAVLVVVAVIAPIALFAERRRKRDRQ